jgi:RHS repeat-associated protein
MKTRFALLAALASLALPLVSLAGTAPPPRPGVTVAGNLALGPYSYDASGNIKSIGTDEYSYDGVDRVKSATSAGAVQQSYTYDAFGNLKAIVTAAATHCLGGVDCGRGAMEVDPLTNRLTSFGSTYDEAGNLKQLDLNSYEYDAAGMMTKQTGGDVPRQFIYTADDERLATYTTGNWSWTVRDLKGAVLSDFSSADDPSAGPAAASWQWKEDYVYRGTQMLAANLPQGRRHFHLDHLGTPRLVTDDAGRQLGLHKYLPFGAELDLGLRENPEDTKKFTGHERDGNGDLHGLDYMHARFYGWGMGRFVSVDPLLESTADGTKPQAWNRYAYVSNNPVRAVDPDGRKTYLVSRSLEVLQTKGVRLSMRANPITHTFILTTSKGGHTYSWGNSADGKTIGKWFQDAKIDTEAAREAMVVGSKWVMTEKGDDSLDPYIQKAFDLHANKKDDPSNHTNWMVCNNCKTEASSLIKEAQGLQAEDMKLKKEKEMEKRQKEKDVDGKPQ